jgi:hypothetical protein
MSVINLHVGFLGGLVAMGLLVASAFFLRFWLRTRDGLFLAFSAAFALMSLNQALLILLEVPREEQSPFYLLRLAAFLLIIVAVMRKNSRPRAS